VNTSILREAIEKKQLLQFTFKGFQRIAEPHAYGIKNNKRMLLVYQIAGGTSSGSVPDWRLIPIDEIKNLGKTGQGFAAARELPSGDYGKWDTLISQSK
jgi:hypothetical protein